MAVENCNIRFMDNNKAGNYTVTNEDSNYPLSNALSNIRSRLFKTTGTQTRITVDLLFPDKVSALTLFAPLGQTLGISKEATIRLEADNVNDWTSPEFSEVLTLTSDDRLIHFTDIEYRFVSLYIDDPANPEGVISFADLYIGDYTTTSFRNIAPKFKWTHNDKTVISKSLNGTAYYRERIKYDTFTGLKLSLVGDEDRQTIEDLYARVGKSNWMPIALDPGTFTTSSINDLTRLARFSSNLSVNHVSKSRYDMSFGLEEVI